MSGVTRKTSLKKICWSERVTAQFMHGVYFMEFDQDATLQKVRDGISG